MPEAEGVAVGVEQVGKRLKFVPLISVVRVSKFARIGAFAWRLDFDKANQGVADGDSIVRARFEMRKRCLAD